MTVDCSLLTAISSIRNDYSKAKLSQSSVDPDPIRQFDIWLQNAIDAELPEPTAMVLSTGNPEGVISSRTVLLKGVVDNHFVFYTNYHSRKGTDLEQNPNAALTFLWPELERQINIQGTVVKVSDEISDEYFQSRPRKYRLAAWASKQSEVLDSEKILIQEFLKLTLKYAGRKVPRPFHWGGYMLKPLVIQFWQGRPSRLHDRIQYQLTDDTWVIKRLFP